MREKAEYVIEGIENMHALHDGTNLTNLEQDRNISVFCANPDTVLTWEGPTDEKEKFRQKVISGLNSKYRCDKFALLWGEAQSCLPQGNL